jgi:hypothetical protein
MQWNILGAWRGRFVLAITLLLPLVHGSAFATEVAPGKSDPPDAADLQRSTQVVHEIYVMDIVAAKTAEEKVTFSKKLLTVGVDEKDIATQYAVFLLARDTAVQAADLSAIAESVDAIDKRYRIDALKMKADAAANVAAAIRTSQEREEFINQSELFIDQALAGDRFDVAKQLAELDVGISHSAMEQTLSDRSAATLQRVTETEAAYAKVKKALVVIAQTPDDPQANLVVGKYLCYIKGRLGQGPAGTRRRR